MPRPCLERCPKCPGRRDSRLVAVAGDGPSYARVMLVGESPGIQENNMRRPFVGKTGEEMNRTYLSRAGLTRDDVYFTNTVKCHCEDKPGDELIDSCSKFHLQQEIEWLNPDVIVLMGAVACSLVPDLDIETHHGFPFTANLFGTRRKVFATYHPALGLHDGRMMLHLLQDFERLGKYLNDTLRVPKDEHPAPEYARLKHPSDVFTALTMGGDDEIAIDTEWDQNSGDPWSMQFSTMPGTGYLIRYGDKACMDVFNERCTWIGFKRWLIHNSMYDLDVTPKFEMEIPMNRLVDTMMEAYHIGFLPQSLKQLAWRLCGIKMLEYEDLVVPWARQIQADFIMRASAFEYPKPEPEIIDDEKGMRWYRPQGMSTKLKRAITDLKKNPETKLQDRWFKWAQADRWMAEDKLGERFPKPSIAMVPEEDAIQYACRDADATLRVWQVLKRLKRATRSRLI